MEVMVSCRAGFGPGDLPWHSSKHPPERSHKPVTHFSQPPADALWAHCSSSLQGLANPSARVTAPTPAVQGLDLLHLHLVASTSLYGAFPSQEPLISLSFGLCFDTLMCHPCLHFCHQIEQLVRNDFPLSQTVNSFHDLSAEWLTTNTCSKQKCAGRTLEDIFVLLGLAKTATGRGGKKTSKYPETNWDALL